MQSEYSSLTKSDRWDLVPPREGKNIGGSHWIMKVKRHDDEDSCVDHFKARLVSQEYSKV